MPKIAEFTFPRLGYNSPDKSKWSDSYIDNRPLLELPEASKQSTTPELPRLNAMADVHIPTLQSNSLLTAI